MAGHTFPVASVIIVSYNGRPFLDACLGALVRQAYPGEYAIVVVDNASTDGSADFVRSH